MSFLRRDFLRMAASAAALPCLGRDVFAQSYPAKPITLLVPLPAGSAADGMARTLAPQMGARWGQPVTVENRPGAGTTLGVDAVAKAPADGYTLLVISASFSAVAATSSKLPYDPLKDFAPISRIATAPLVLVAIPSLGVKSLKELVETAKTKPGQITLGHTGVGTGSHFAAELINIPSAIKVAYASEAGPAEVLAGMVAGRIHFAVLPVGPAIPFIRDGRLLALGVTTARRSSALPDVPTIAEAGIAGYEYQDWWGVFAPAATPKAVIETIGAEIGRSFALPEVTAQLLSRGVQPSPTTPEQFTAFVNAEIAALRQVAKTAGIRAD